jgi:phosphatidylinositol alpha-1,6-mannosyltransferase
MKTLLFTLEYPPFHGGIANYYGNLAKYWPIEEKLTVFDNSQEELVSSRARLSWLPAIASLNRKLTKGQFDYLLVGQILPLGTVAFLVSLFKPIKYGVFLHGMDLAMALKVPRKRFLSKLILRRADKIICANSYVRDKLFESWPELEDKTRIVNPGIESGVPNTDANDLIAIKNTYSLEGKTVLLTLGRLVKRKGVDRTIEAILKLPEEASKNLLYFIAGAGHREEYLKKLVPLSYAKKIIFLGALNESEKWAWLKLCDIFIMPSRDISGDFEGFGIVYLEANLCEKPVIAGNSGGVRDAVIDEETGLMVDPDKVELIGEAIVRLANDSELSKKLGQQGRARALKNFNWEQQALKVLQIIK